jgi:hypothetical protein
VGSALFIIDGVPVSVTEVSPVSAIVAESFDCCTVAGVVELGVGVCATGCGTNALLLVLLFVTLPDGALELMDVIGPLPNGSGMSNPLSPVVAGVSAVDVVEEAAELDVALLVALTLKVRVVSFGSVSDM